MYQSQSSSDHQTKPPEVRPLPWALTVPMRLTPSRLHSTALATALNQVFATEIRNGELDFLQDRVLTLRIDDAGVEVHVTLWAGRFRNASRWQVPELTISGNFYEFMLLASRREDPDTLFFSRRLRLEGDTELGLYVKNFLDALELETVRLPLPVRHFLQYAVPVYERLLGR